jgi:hypothetical protein
VTLKSAGKKYIFGQERGEVGPERNTKADHKEPRYVPRHRISFSSPHINRSHLAMKNAIRSFVFALLLASLYILQAVAAQGRSLESSALRSASYDGSWVGVVNCLYDPGLWPDDECAIGLNFEIHGNAISVKQIVHTKKGQETISEVNKGKFQFDRLASNAVAISMDSGEDDDGTWVETWSFAMTLRDPDHMVIHWTRIVNNLDMPKEKKGSKFSSVGLGELVRVGSKL